jgi:hypothetical protein
MTTKPASASGSEPPKKKAYESPRLEVYGDIREIARSVGTKGKADGAARRLTKTR